MIGRIVCQLEAGLVKLDLRQVHQRQMALAEYLHYMQQVLGIREVLLSTPLIDNEASERLPMSTTPQRKVLFIDKHTWSPAAHELFSKMREAMKLSTDEIKILFSQETALADIQLQGLQSQEIVSFDPEVSQALQPDFKTQLTTTIGPEVLVKDAGKKKITWNDLQSVMKRLS